MNELNNGTADNAAVPTHKSITDIVNSNPDVEFNFSFSSDDDALINPISSIDSVSSDVTNKGVENFSNEVKVEPSSEIVVDDSNADVKTEPEKLIIETPAIPGSETPVENVFDNENNKEENKSDNLEIFDNNLDFVEGSDKSLSADTQSVSMVANTEEYRPPERLNSPSVEIASVQSLSNKEIVDVYNMLKDYTDYLKGQKLGDLDEG